jgi:CRP/FNR family transcriptional regulator, cyclic AMP receptor protein
MQRTYRLRLKSAVAIPESARKRLFALGRIRRFADGQFIMQQGEVARGFFAVASGQVMVGRHTKDGTLTIFGVAGPGDLFGEQAFFTASPRLSDAVADGPVEVFWFDGPLFRKVIAGDPEIVMLLLRSMAGQLRTLTERVDADRNLTLVDRLAHVLLTMDADADEAVACTQQQLADLIGVSRVSLGGALRQLEKSGAVAGSYGRVRIVNRAALESRLATGNQFQGDTKAA